MIKPFHTEEYLGSRKKDYFEGWYFRHLGEPAFSFIVGVSKCRRDPHAFIQYIDLTRSAYFRYPLEAFRFERDGMTVAVAGNTFSERGINVDVSASGLEISAHIDYQNMRAFHKSLFTPSAMGPLGYLPLACNHAIVSMSHAANGTLSVNGTVCDYAGTGYIEKDFGSKFPANYFWMHAANDEVSLVTAVARPVALGLRGHICVIDFRGKQYNLSLYELGRIRSLDATPEGVRCSIQKGKDRVDLAIRNDPGAQTLLAPDKNGDMTVRIQENLRASLTGRLTLGGAEYDLASLGPCAFELVSDTMKL